MYLYSGKTLEIMSIKNKYLFAPADNDVFRHYLAGKLSAKSRIFILMDENTKKFCKSTLVDGFPELEQAVEIRVNSGEENKSLETCNNIWLKMIESHADRHSLLINLGGGVISDLGGFAASSYKRGISFCNIPTTLLGMIDASIGGKTGVDFDGIKNVIGCFSYAEKTFISPAFLKTLPERQLNSGFTEILKIALVTDKLFWKKLGPLKPADVEQKPELIKKAVALKNKIVDDDPTEKNIRKKLNFGHTIGHAVESFPLIHDKKNLLHGEAIAIGMICEAWISKKKNLLSGSELDEIIYKLLRFTRKYKLTNEKKELLKLMRNDKKNTSRNINFTLLNGIGDAGIDHYIDEKLISESLMFYNNLI